jgi:hypothetical protein
MAENHSLDENVTPNSEVDQYWADLLSPARRRFIIQSGLMAAGAGLTAGCPPKRRNGKRVVSPVSRARSRNSTS